MQRTVIPLYRQVEQFIASRPSTVACAAGCDACCHLPVDVTAVELIALTQHLLETASPDELQRIKASARSYLAQIEGLEPERRLKVRHPCPLLVNKQCSAYDMRPLPCRGFHSGNKSQCDRVLRGAENAAFDFTDIARLEASRGAVEVLRQSSLKSGRDTNNYDLAPALALILEDPEAAFERWADGGRLIEATEATAVEPEVLPGAPSTGEFGHSNAA